MVIKKVKEYTHLKKCDECGGVDNVKTLNVTDCSTIVSGPEDVAFEQTGATSLVVYAYCQNCMDKYRNV